jgi:dipeptidyl aminopeptidase/acylaminoacyl peptidase
MPLQKTFALLSAFTLLTVLFASAGVSAQTPDLQPAARPAHVPMQYTAAQYAQAEKFMAYNADALVLHEVSDPTWLPDGRMVYRDNGPRGWTYTLVDPVKATKTPAFDLVKLAAALESMNPNPSRPFDPNHLLIGTFTLADHDQTVILGSYGNRVSCDLSGAGVCKALDASAQAGGGVRGRRRNIQGGEDIAPDGIHTVFIRDWNLWLRDRATKTETQLTFDGVKDYGYATDNAGWTHSDDPIVVWSPDSKRVATFQQDQRKTGEIYLTNVTNGHPTLTTLKYPLPGDKDVTMIERVVIDLPAKPGDKAKIVRLKMPPDQHRSTLCDDISCRGGSGWDDVEWAADSKSLAFVSTSRDHKHETVRLANPQTGDVRDVLDETTSRFFESGNDKTNWHYLSATNELLWFSERSGWGQLYLYDIATGKLKNAVTSGDWNVTQVLNVDQKARTIYFVGVGKESGEDPYYPMYYRVGFDGQKLELLTPERAAHIITPSPDNRFFVDSYSTPIEPQITVLRDATGKTVVDVARADITKLKATGWIPPVQIEVKATDGVTDLYGFLFRPTNFSTDKQYPIVDHVYPGPQSGWGGLSCGSRDFRASRGDLQSLAELGFIVVCIDGQGGAYRSKAFHEAYFGKPIDDTIPDQVAGLKQLADRYPWIDLSRAGIFGHSGGGRATAAAMFRFPDFFSVGISESGNHDNRIYEDDWDEKWLGLLETNADGTSNYDNQANQRFAKNLKGHLLLAHGTSDDNVPLANTLLVVDALIKANKDFDLVLFPNEHHGYGAGAAYMTRRRWDYFVRYLGGDIPPPNYTMQNMGPRGGRTAGPGDVDWDTMLPAETPWP